MSRALDALVAEQVMGEPCPPIPSREEYTGFPIFDTGPSSPGGAWYLGTTGYEDGDRLAWHCLPFSTDLNAAWRVVARLNQVVAPDNTVTGHDISIHTCNVGATWVVAFGPFNAEAATVTEAICLAALKALGVPIPETP